jgi:hypothetical protein
MTHALTRALRRRLPRPLSLASTRYLSLLDRRLGHLERCAESEGRGPGGGTTIHRETPRTRLLARRFLKPHEGSWTDGDENLVRGHLDGWSRPGIDPDVAAAQALLACARTLAQIEAPSSTLWFFLWEMESMLESGSLVSRSSIPGGR